MAAVAARAVMGTKRVAPCPIDGVGPSIDPGPHDKDSPQQPQGCWVPRLLSGSSDTLESANADVIIEDGSLPGTPPGEEGSGAAESQTEQLDSAAESSSAGNCADEKGDVAADAGTPVFQLSPEPPPHLSKQEASEQPGSSREVAEPAPCQEENAVRLHVAAKDNAATAPKNYVAMASAKDAAAVPGAEDGAMRVSPKHQLSAAALVEGGMQEMEADTCSICLEDFTLSDPATLTQCNHEYHFQCVLEWAQRKEECPLCWQALRLSDPSSQELLDACARDRKERAAAAALLAETATALPIGYRMFARTGASAEDLRNAANGGTSSRHRSSSPWHLARASPSITSAATSAPSGGVSALFSRDRSGRTRGAAPGAGARAEAGVGAGAGAGVAGGSAASPPPSSRHPWFRRGAPRGGPRSFGAEQRTSSAPNSTGAIPLAAYHSTVESSGVATSSVMPPVGPSLSAPAGGGASAVGIGGSSSTLLLSSGYNSSHLASETVYCEQDVPGGSSASGIGDDASLASTSLSRLLSEASEGAAPDLLSSRSSSDRGTRSGAATAAAGVSASVAQHPAGNITLRPATASRFRGASGPSSPAVGSPSSAGSSWKAMFSFRSGRS